MPVYKFKCSCGNEVEEFRPLVDFVSHITCKCGTNMNIVIQSIGVINDFHEAYYDYGLGQVIRTRQERKQVMKEKKLEEVGTTKLDPEAVRLKKERDYNKVMEQVNAEAYKILGEAQGNSQWN